MTALDNFIKNNPEDILPIDQADVEDAEACAEYVKEIYAYLLFAEEHFRLPENFLMYQESFNETDRTLLFDWVSRIHSKFSLANESFFHFCMIFDMLCTKVQILPYDEKITAMACLLIASKFEESYIPSLRHYVDVLAKEPGVRYVNCSQCVYQAQNMKGLQLMREGALYNEGECCSESEMLAMQQLPPCEACAKTALINCEEEILHLLDFNLSFPTSLTFLRRYSKISDLKARDRYIAFYIGELCHCNYNLVMQFSPSLIAAGCIAMTRRLTRRPSWCPELEVYSGYSENDIKPVLAEVSVTLKALALSPKVKNIRKKYSEQDRFYGVSLLIENVVQQIMGQ